MMKITTQRRLLPVFAIASLVLAACGRSDDDTAADNKRSIRQSRRPTSAPMNCAPTPARRLAM